MLFNLHEPGSIAGSSRCAAGNQRRPLCFFWRGASAAAALALSGCMLTPTDDGRVSSRETSIRFGGYHTEPNAPVQIRAWDFAANQMVNVGAPVRSSTREAISLDQPLYDWSAERRLENRFWREGPVAGHCAVTRASTELNGREYNLMTVESDWINCPADTVGGFYAECRSSNSPVAKIYTSDWAPVPLPQSRLNLAALLASSRIRITFDNYTPTAYEFCSGSTPGGCPPGGASDPETYKFYRPNGSSFRQQDGETMSFSIPPSRSNPMTVYIDDMSSRSLDFRAEGSSFVLGINFESSGPEIRMNCIRNIACAFVDGKTIDFTSPRAELRFQLTAEAGEVTFSDVTATFTGGTPGDEAAQASAAIGEAITKMVRDDASIRAAVSSALDAVIRGAAELDQYPIEGVTIRNGSIQVQPGCPMD